MTFTYKYILKNPSNRKKEDLIEHKENIMKAIKRVFPKSCKDVLVEKDYFEFKLHLKASDGELRKMRRELVRIDNALDKMKKVKEKGSELFIRANSSYYAYLEHFSKDDNEIILDVDMVQKFDLPMYTKSLENHNDIGKREVFRNMDTYKLSLYIDNWKEDKRILKILGKLKEANWYLIQGKLSNTEDESEIFLDFTAWHRSDKRDGSKLISGFKLTLIEEVNDSEITELDRSFSIEGIEYRDAPTYTSELDKFKVIIYNVGQGLCSAVCDESNHPYIYFDFGRGCWRNRCTYPDGMYYDTTHNQSTNYIISLACRPLCTCLRLQRSIRLRMDCA